MSTSPKKSSGMILDGIFASEAWDSSSEKLELKGLCIDDFTEGKGTVNWEHRGGDSNGASALDTVGKVIYAKKIMSEKDIEDDRQRYYWEKVKEIPYLYGVVRLYDGAGHIGAQAIAAQIRDHVANNEPILIRWSIEGSTLKRKDNILEESVAKRVALTLAPCNKTCDTSLISDPNAPPGFDKNPNNTKKDILADLADAKKNERHSHPNFTSLGGSVQTEFQPLTKEDSWTKKLKKLIKAKVLLKAFEASSYDAAPSSLVGGAAIQVEDPSLKRKGLVNRAKSALRDYGHRIGEHNRKDFVKFMKHYLPDADSDFIDKFANLVDDYHVKLNKSNTLRLDYLTIQLKKSVAEVKKPPVNKVDANIHGMHLEHPEQHALIHGLDVTSSAPAPEHFDTHGIQGDESKWVKTPNDKSAYMKPSLDFGLADISGEHNKGNDFPTARAEAAYHNIAHSVFGLGKYVPTTAAFKHPNTDAWHSVSETVPDAEHLPKKGSTPEHIIKLGDEGELDKLAMMNMAMGNSDRHNGNYLVSPKGIHLIDNGLAFQDHPTVNPPGYLQRYIKHKNGISELGSMDIHPDAMQWASKINPDHFYNEMTKHGVPEENAQSRVLYLKKLQARINHHMSHNKPMNFGEALRAGELDD